MRDIESNTSAKLQNKHRYNIAGTIRTATLGNTLSELCRKNVAVRNMVYLLKAYDMRQGRKIS